MGWKGLSELARDPDWVAFEDLNSEIGGFKNGTKLFLLGAA